MISSSLKFSLKSLLTNSSRRFNHNHRYDIESLTAFANDRYKGEYTFDVCNPANGEVLGQLPSMGRTDVDNYAALSYEAWKSWKQTTGRERSAIIAKMVCYCASQLTVLI